MNKLTDRVAIRIALEMAITEEESLIAANRSSFTGKVNEEDLGVITARRHIVAFKRVLARYYGGYVPEEKRLGKVRSVSVYDILKEAACPACGGVGYYQHGPAGDVECPACKGTGRAG